MRATLFAIVVTVVPAAWAQPCGPLSAPTGLDASDGVYSMKVGLAWDHVCGADSYRVHRGDTEDPAGATAIGATPSILFFDRSAVPGQAYFYWVEPLAGDDGGPWSAPEVGTRGVGINNGFGAIAPLEPPPEPPENPVTGAKVYLGKTLFWDEQMSSTRDVACGTCHRPRNGGADPRALPTPVRAVHPGPDGVFGNEDDIGGSPGVPLHGMDGTYEWSPLFGLGMQVTGRKAPSVFNAAYAGSDSGLFWDGRASNVFRDPLTGEVLIAAGGALESQAVGPPLSDVEMNSRDAAWGPVTARLGSVRPLGLSPSIPRPLHRWIGERGYPELFAEAFGTPAITPSRIAFAIASYERTLFTDRAPIDLAVSGLRELPQESERGRQVFFDATCDACHLGGLLSDDRFRGIGVRPADEDIGRQGVTRDSRDRGKFRTPSLRNLGLRAPYMHNGGFTTIEAVVDFYNDGGDFPPALTDRGFIRRLGLSDGEKQDLVAFLKNELNDPRVNDARGPIFDRPLLYTESARVPRVSGDGVAGPTGAVPQMFAAQPAVLGNPGLTVGVAGVAPGAEVTLVIDAADPGLGLAPEVASFARVVVTAGGETTGYASATVAVPADEALAGETLYARWYVAGGAVGVSGLAEIPVFAPAAALSTEPPVVTVSAASLAQGPVAPGSIVSGFGGGLSAQTVVAAMTPLPTELGGVTVTVTDAEGAARLAALVFVSPGQVNYLVPEGTAVGEAAVVVRGGAEVRGTLQVRASAPALFAANADGKGVAAAIALRVAADGSQQAETVATFDEAVGRFVARPLRVAGEGEQLILLLFGTGIRGAGDVAVSIGGEDVVVLYAGPQGEFAGLDQVNVPVPSDFAGRGTVEIRLSAGGSVANFLEARFVDN